jgi:hypothetical protein
MGVLTDTSQNKKRSREERRAKSIAEANQRRRITEQARQAKVAATNETNFLAGGKEQTGFFGQGTGKFDAVGGAPEASGSPSSSGGGGVGMGQAVTALNSLKSADEGSSEVGNTSGGAGAADGAMKGAAAGAPMAAATGGASVAIGAVVGGTIGILKAKSNRKKKKALATAEHQRNLASIEGQKGERIQTAMNQMRQSFSNALSIRSSVNLGG